MARWQGWGAGPAGAGSARPSRVFLGGVLVGCVVVTAVLLKDGRLGAAAITALAAVYFALRAFAGLGR